MSQSQKQNLKKPNGFCFSNPGNPIQPVMKRVFDEESKEFVVKEVSKFNLYEFIQSSASSSDLAQLRATYFKTGIIPEVDPTLQHGVETLKVNNIHELYQAVDGARESFGQLPENIQKIFGDADTYVKSLLKGDAASILTAGLTKQVEPEPTPAPVSGESE